MTTILHPHVKKAIEIAQAIAKENMQPQFSAAHLLQGLLHNEIGLAALLVTWGKDIHYLREWADLRIEQVPRAAAVSDAVKGDAAVQKVMEVADMERLKLGEDDISPAAMLAAICKPEVAFTKDQLKSFPLSEKEMLSNLIAENGVLRAVSGTGTSENGTVTASQSNGQSNLFKYCIDKTEMAAEDRLDPIVGRDKEIRQMSEVLGRRSKPNPIIVGEPGVGKTALVDGFANLISEDKVPSRLLNARLFELDSGALIAGASYKGEIEDRLKKIIKELKAQENAILFIDEIHMLLDPNAGFGGAANLLKPELARGELTVIGATTNKEYREYIEGDPAFSRRFDKVIVEEPEPNVAIKMVDHISQKYIDHHQINIAEDTIPETIQLAQRYISEKRLPDAAIDLLDNTMSAIQMASESSPEQIVNFENTLHAMDEDSSIEDYQWLVHQIKYSLSPILTSHMENPDLELLLTPKAFKQFIQLQLDNLKTLASVKRTEVNPSDIAAVVANKTSIPIGKLQSNEKERLLSIEEELRKRVVGQDGAIQVISKAILESRAGLKKANKPVGSFFFTGPTGTGKTELAKTLAEFLFNDETALIRFDMSEFKESVSAALLYGASPGYVGYKEGGLLVNKIREKPYSIVLFDEIEKAHASIFDVFLQILDEGRLTDKQGRKGDFSNAVILFTSNLGQRHIVDHLEEKGELPDSDWVKEMYMNDPTVTFRPEFLGRMDAIVPFAPISKEVAKLIFKIQLKDLIKLLKKQGIGFEMTEAATEYLAMEGFNPKFGARPIRDMIKKRLRQPLSFKIISNEIKEGDIIKIDYVNDELLIEPKEINHSDEEE